MKKWLAISLKGIISGGLIWYLFSGIDLELVGFHLAGVDLGLVALSLVIFLVQIVIGGKRWASVLTGLGAQMRQGLFIRLFYVGAFLNQALPGGSGGDAVRMYLSYKLGLSLRNAVNGVIIERIVTVLALVVLVDITQLLFVKELSHDMRKFSIIGAISVTVLLMIGLGTLMQLDRLSERLKKWRLFRGLGNLAADARLVFLSKTRLWRPIVWGLLGHLNISLAVFVLASGLGLQVTLFNCVLLIPPVLLVLTLPISIGGWGVREGAMIWAFALVGVTYEKALVLSLLFGLAGLFIALPGGLIWLTTRDTKDKGAFSNDLFNVLNKSG